MGITNFRFFARKDISETQKFDCAPIFNNNRQTSKASVKKANDADDTGTAAPRLSISTGQRNRFSDQGSTPAQWRGLRALHSHMHVERPRPRRSSRLRNGRRPGLHEVRGLRVGVPDERTLLRLGQAGSRDRRAGEQGARLLLGRRRTPGRALPGESVGLPRALRTNPVPARTRPRRDPPRTSDISIRPAAAWRRPSADSKAVVSLHPSVLLYDRLTQLHLAARRPERALELAPRNLDNLELWIVAYLESGLREQASQAVGDALTRGHLPPEAAARYPHE